MRAYVSLAALCLFLAPQTLGGQAPTPSQDPPTFRSQIQYVEVDVRVTDQAGRVVEGLGPDDFILRDGDQPQTIATFSFVDVPIEPAEVRAAAMTAPDADVVTNAGEGRSYLMVLDDSGAWANQPKTYRVRHIARRFIREAMGVNDQMAVVHVRGDLNAAQGFTRNRGLMLAAIERAGAPFFGGGAGIHLFSASGFAGSDEALNAYDTLQYFAAWLGGMDGGRKAILWIGGSVPFHHGSAAVATGFRDAMRAAVRNNVAIYPVSAAGLTTRLGLGDLMARAALRDVADATGGLAIVGTNNYSGGFRRILDDTSTYYVLGYYPQPEWRDGRFHEVTVNVNRPGLTVRARPGYRAPDPTAPVPALPLPADLSPTAADALVRPAPVPGLAIQAFATAFRGSAGSASVLVGAHLSGDDLRLDAGQQIELAFQAVTPDGVLSPGRRRVVTLNLDAAARDAIQRSGLRVFDRLDLPPGRHQVRIVAHQPGGETGSALAYVDLPEYSEERLTLSGIVLASEAATDRTLASDDAVRAILPADPTMRRRFAASDTLTALAEVYTGGRTPVPVDQVRVTASVTTAGGARVRDGTPAPVAMIPADAGRAAYTVSLPLAGLAPGSYILTIEAQEDERTVRRLVPFAVTSPP
jgi:VWFA-related protein